MLNLQTHGGEDIRSNVKYKKSEENTKNSDKTKCKFINYKLAVFDNIIEQDAQNIDLVDELTVPERACGRQQENGKIPIQNKKTNPSYSS